jgi:GNAT superfamily N-acetyltransferase
MKLASDLEPIVVIRPMRASDRDAVIELLWQLNRHEAEIDLRKQPFALDRDTSHAAAIACFDRDCERAAEHEGALMVADLVVAGGHRGAGIGTRLLAEAERLTRERRLERLAIGVLLGNDGAARVYERFGFRSHSIEMLKALD